MRVCELLSIVRLVPSLYAAFTLQPTLNKYRCLTVSQSHVRFASSFAVCCNSMAGDSCQSILDTSTELLNCQMYVCECVCVCVHVYSTHSEMSFNGRIHRRFAVARTAFSRKCSESLNITEFHQIFRIFNQLHRQILMFACNKQVRIRRQSVGANQTTDNRIIFTKFEYELQTMTVYFVCHTLKQAIALSICSEQ